MDAILCQICQNDITDLSPELRNIHVNTCIDRQIEPEAACDSSEKRVPSEADDQDDVHTAKAPDISASNCHICAEDLSSMYESGRVLHINRCVDKV